MTPITTCEGQTRCYLGQICFIKLFKANNNNKQMCSSLFCRGLDVFRINPGVIICPELLLGLSAACVLGGVAVTTENNFLPGYERILFHVRGRCSGENDLHHHPRVPATSQVCPPPQIPPTASLEVKLRHPYHPDL